MELKTERLILKEISLSDLGRVHELHSLPETDRFNTLGIPESLERTRNHLIGWLDLAKELPRKKYVLCIEDMKRQFVGLFGLNMGKPGYLDAEIWYKLHVDHWNKGYATEAVKALLNFCFKDLDLHRVEAGCAVENTASIRVLEKAGMTREGRTRKKLPIRGEWADNYLYAILDEDYFKTV